MMILRYYFSRLTTLIFVVVTLNNLNVGAQESVQEDCTFSLEYTIEHVTCKGGEDGSVEIKLTGANLPSFLWSNGSSSQNLDMLISGEYSLTVTDGTCSKTIEINISEPDDLILEILDKQDVTCPGFADGMITVQATGGTEPYEFALDGISDYQANDNLTDLPQGEYIVSVRDGNNCESAATFEISEPQTIQIDLGNDIVIESDQEIVFDAGAGFSEYTWSTGESTQIITFLRRVKTTVVETISVDVVDENGCSISSNSVQVTIHPGKQMQDTIPDEQL